MCRYHGLCFGSPNRKACPDLFPDLTSASDQQVRYIHFALYSTVGPDSVYLRFQLAILRARESRQRIQALSAQLHLSFHISNRTSDKSLTFHCLPRSSPHLRTGHDITYVLISLFCRPLWLLRSTVHVDPAACAVFGCLLQGGDRLSFKPKARLVLVDRPS